jgi:hypothetical protein
VLLELYCLEEEEEEGFDPLTLRVQAPYIGRAWLHYVVRLPGCRLPRGCGLGVGPASSCPSNWAQAAL